MSGSLSRPRLNSMIECDEIECGLYLGNLSAARDEKTLMDCKITHILCAFIYPIEYPKHIKSLFIDVEDSDCETIITHFNETNSFIEEGQNQGACLVHCFAGISRSATLVIAFLMKKYKISFLEAMTRVKKKRCWASPNFGFRAQLELYGTMQYTLDYNNRRYRLLLLQQLRNKIIAAQEFGAIADYLDIIIPKINGDKFKCKRCRKYLFSEANILYHNQGCLLDWKNDHLEKSQQTCAWDEVLFTELLTWMSQQVTCSSGEISCPKCQAKLGNFSWSSHVCLCNASIQPSFKIIVSKVDRERTLSL